jgi:zinc D-Ala-D-Ala carboxypeptidase
VGSGSEGASGTLVLELHKILRSVQSYTVGNQLSNECCRYNRRVNRVERTTLTVLSGLLVVTVLVGCAPERAPLASEPSLSVPTTVPTVEIPTPTPTPTPTFDMSAKSIDDPKSFWVIVNKRRQLDPKDYAPADLVAVPANKVYDAYLRVSASRAVVRMFAAFKKETGKQMTVQSAYRSFASQTRIFNGYVASEGREKAERGSARPGHSEHQTGLAVDVGAVPAKCAIAQCFATTPQGKWLAKHAWEYGFVLRYPKGKEAITGYIYEPWHYRFVGKDLAKEFHDTGAVTLEEFFGLPAAPDYAK